MSPGTLKYATVLMLIGYALTGLWTRRLPEGERYPFFSWFLFNRIPQISETAYNIRILEAGGTPLQPPVTFKDAAPFFSTVDNSPAAYYQLIQELGQALAAHDTLEGHRVQKVLDQHFTAPVLYEVLKVTYNPIEYWRSAQWQEAVRLAVFKAAGPKP